MELQRDTEEVRSLECDLQRKSRMLSDLRSRLDIDTKGQDKIARVKWLFLHVEDYVDRWTACVTFFSMGDFLHNNLHLVLTIGIDLIDEEVRDLVGCDAFKEKWQDFASVVRTIDKDTSKSITEELELKLDFARKILLDIAH